jgi:hypothetical protein
VVSPIHTPHFSAGGELRLLGTASPKSAKSLKKKASSAARIDGTSLEK